MNRQRQQLMQLRKKNPPTHRPATTVFTAFAVTALDQGQTVESWSNIGIKRF